MYCGFAVHAMQVLICCADVKGLSQVYQHVSRKLQQAVVDPDKREFGVNLGHDTPGSLRICAAGLQQAGGNMLR